MMKECGTCDKIISLSSNLCTCDQKQFNTFETLSIKMYHDINKYIASKSCYTRKFMYKSNESLKQVLLPLLSMLYWQLIYLLRNIIWVKVVIQMNHS